MSTTQHFHSMQDFARHMQDIARAADPPNRLAWLRRVMGESIRDMIKASFLAGKDPDGNPWKSSAAVTQHGGRFAASYHRRPSGAEVTADKSRLTDTAELRGSYKILSVDPDQVTVGPEGERNINIATRAETEWGNGIAGWGASGSFRERFATIEINKAWENMMQGIPLARIHKPSFRAV